MGCGASKAAPLGVVPVPSPVASSAPNGPLASPLPPASASPAPTQSESTSNSTAQSTHAPTAAAADADVKSTPAAAAPSTPSRPAASAAPPSPPPAVRSSPSRPNASNASAAPSSPAPSSSSAPAASPSSPAVSSSVSSSSTDVFLGGSCHPTTWRRDIAIPMLSRWGVRYYNPQVDNWSEELIAIESRAKEEAAILFFVIDSETRALASIVECTEYLCSGREVILVIRRLKDGAVIGGDKVGSSEMKDLNRARAYIEELAKRHGTAVYPTVETACEEIIKRIGSRRKLVEVIPEAENGAAKEAGKTEKAKVIVDGTPFTSPVPPQAAGEPSTVVGRDDSIDPNSQPYSASSSGSDPSSGNSSSFDAALHAKADRKSAALQTALGANYVSVNDLENVDAEDPLISPSSSTAPTQGVPLPMVDFDAAKLRMQMEMAN